ncbi:holo-ACP synthase [Paenibacillus sp. FJAT-26967]|uniref:holo-ACP synthase n=1 Tax=Paenibacillus sp. FJAT-26967 TaxID=1729690 RepID=UPI0008383BB2|nr:holo-ACP synthase [Paenibacillus sp. FJAT-26967]
MITGVGMDLVEIGRIAEIIKEPSGDRFLRRILTEEERGLADRRQGRLKEFTAGRFAAKEAVVKALGCGIGKQVGFQDISIVPDELGKPHCRISAAARDRLGLHPELCIHISITHTGSLAAAYAVAEQPDHH